MNKLNSVLFLSNHAFLPERAGGLEASTNELCIALKANGVNVSVLCSGTNYGTVLNDSESAYWLSVDYLLGYPVYRAKDPARSLHVVTNLEKIDCLVIHLDKKFELPDAAKSINITTIFYLRDVQFETKFWKLRTFPKAVFAANSNFSAARAQSEFGIQAKVIHPLIDINKYITTRIGNFITFINPVPKKGIELALKLAQLRPAYQFLFVEGWPLTKEQRAYYQNRASLPGNITWLANQVDMRTVYCQTKLIIVPSVWEEAWGRVVTEAQISGIPAVVSNRGGLPEAVGDAGFVVDPSDEQGWLDAIDKLYNDEDCYVEKSNAAIQESHRAELTHGHIINLFLELLNA